jgi:hypothetical protein
MPIRIVVDINGFPVTYKAFYESLKARGDISDEVMVAHVELFNECVDKCSSRKLSFSPYFAVVDWSFLKFILFLKNIFLLNMGSIYFLLCRESLMSPLNILMPTLLAENLGK